jgi:hypothetical protein
MQATTADLADVLLFDTSTGSLKIVAQRSFNSEFLCRFKTVTGNGCACGLAMNRGRRVVVRDTLMGPLVNAAERRIATIEYSVHSWQNFLTEA